LNLFVAIIALRKQSMAKLVVFSAGLAGSSHELKVDKTTIGRVDDNTFPIAEASVSSHHCEVLVRGSDVMVKDLNSTNGTFINGEKITESILKPGQTLRLGQVEMRLETEETAAVPMPSPAPGAAAVTPVKKPLDQTVVMRGVSLNELEQGPRAAGFDTASKAFSKKSNQTNRLFIIVGIITFVVIVLVILIAFSQIKK
jgi:pSer/pThr/pTyr-binding forkhead associated (FHA) protein